MQFSETLLLWYERHGRHLPWRGTGNPYHVWLSEIILQQTRVAQGTAYYYRFLEHFPSITALANAPLEEVMKCWQGLGYYTRARNLHKAAKLLVAEYNGNLPADYEQLKRIPGLGPYAAGAVASFAYNLPAPAIDGNGYRVLARVFGLFAPPYKSAGQRSFRELCLKEMDKTRPGDFNQALIDFGALQCIAHGVQCTECPMTRFCYAYQYDKQEVLPLRAPSIVRRIRYFQYGILLDGEYTYLELRRAKDIWHSLYQFPLWETKAPMSSEQFVAYEPLQTLIGTDYTLKEKVLDIVQKLTHQELHISFFVLNCRLKKQIPTNYLRILRERIKEYPMPATLVRYQRLVED